MAQRFGAGAADLPAPDTGALGGVMRNTGSAGQFVSGIGSDGSLQYNTPSGGGGVIVRAMVGLNGHTSAEVPATAPDVLHINITGIAQGTANLYTDAGSYAIAFDYTNPGGGWLWVDITTGSPGVIANNLAAAIMSASANLSAYAVALEVVVSNIATGATARLNYDDTVGSDVSGGGYGTDLIPAGAEQSSALLIKAPAGKVIRPLAAYYASAGLGQVVILSDDHDGGLLVNSGLPDTSGAVAQVLPDFSASIAKWQYGCVGPIYFYFNSPTVGGAAQVLMIAEILDVADYGTFLFYTCSGFDYVAIYADGTGGTYNTVVEYGSSYCGIGS